MDTSKFPAPIGCNWFTNGLHGPFLFGKNFTDYTESVMGIDVEESSADGRADGRTVYECAMNALKAMTNDLQSAYVSFELKKVKWMPSGSTEHTPEWIYLTSLARVLLPKSLQKEMTVTFDQVPYLVATEMGYTPVTGTVSA